MRSYVPLLLLLLTAARPAPAACPPAEACRCADADYLGLSTEAFVTMQRDRADWVATAEVVRIDTLAPVVLRLSRDTVTTRPVVARLAVRRSYKGEAPDTQTVLLTTTAYRSSCDLSFTAGDSYLVFASREPDGQLQPKRCGGTVRLRDASSALAVLDPGNAPRP